MNLTTEDVAARFRRSVRTVEGWRQRDRGPKWFRTTDGKDKQGRENGRVLYRLKDVEKFEAERST